MSQTEGDTRQVNGVSVPPPGEYELDSSHTDAEFVARHMLSKVRGKFGDVTGTITIAEPLENSTAEVEIKSASVNTGDAKRDGHLNSADFFDTETYPTIAFKSSAVRLTGGSDFELDGDLTIKDTTKPLTLKGTFLGWGKDMMGADRLFAEASARVNREEWGLTWNMAVELTSVLVGKDVDLELQVQAAKSEE
jgi:polyisoprenoid-binding protein YceI